MEVFFLMLFFRCIMGSIWNHLSGWQGDLFTQYNACFSWSQLSKPLVDSALEQYQRSAPRSLKLELTGADRLCQAAFLLSFAPLFLWTGWFCNTYIEKLPGELRSIICSGRQSMKQMHTDKQGEYMETKPCFNSWYISNSCTQILLRAH